MRAPSLPAGVELTDGALSICPGTNRSERLNRQVISTRAPLQEKLVNPSSGSRNKTDSREIVVATIRAIKFVLLFHLSEKKKREIQVTLDRVES
jgi:hypothetical protein